MSYPQPSADQYAIQGVPFFRLLTPLTSPGDIYESAQGGHAFALGPESDVANVVVAYFDEQTQTFVNTITIGPWRSFVGLISARNEARYAPSGRPGRIFFWPADLYDPSWTPAGFAPNTQTLTFIQPILDVVEYFSPQPSLVPRRDDKTYRFEGIPNNGASGWIVVPYWGRRSATIRFTNFTTADVQFAIRGVDYFINDPGGGATRAVERLLISGVITPNLFLDTILTSNSINDPGGSVIAVRNFGAFDALAIFVQMITQDGPVPLEVTVSDAP